MSIPILYDSDVTNFSNNGIGFLSDCISCEVTEEANGIFELSMKYPCDGIHFDSIQNRCIIRAKADQFRMPQLFRVYSKTKNISGIATILAEHISYDLSGIVVSPFSAESVGLALAGFKNNSVVDCPFDFWTDKDTSARFSVSVPSSIRSRLGGSGGSILDVYGGELEFDNTTVKLYNNRGRDRGVSIRYGKNLTDFKQEENCASVYTGIYPYWVDAETSEVFELPEKIVAATGTYNFVKIKAVDFSADFEEKPTEEQLRAKAEKYVEDNEIGVPSVSMSVSFVQLEQTEEYKHLKILERVSLFDTVSVVFPALNVSTKAKAVKVVYDVLLDRVKSVTLGKIRANISDTVAKQEKEIATAPTKTDLEKAKEVATAWLTNGKGYSYFRKDDLGNIVDILFMDTQDLNTAVNVMRVGQSGIGFSHNGVNGPYESAWTIDGKFNADFIYSGYISASFIKGGSFFSEGKSILRPTYDDCVSMLRSVNFPDMYPPKSFYDLNGDGKFDVGDALLALNVFYGTSDISECVSLEESVVTVKIDPGNPLETVKVFGTNMWGSEISVIFGANKTTVPVVSGDFSVGGRLSVKEFATIPKLALFIGEEPKELSWKDNGDGTFTLIGQ